MVGEQKAKHMIPYESGTLEVSHMTDGRCKSMVRTDSDFQVLASPEFGDVDDLTDVESEMFDNNGNDIEDGPFAILNSRHVKQARRFEESEGSIRLLKCVIQLAEELLLLDLLALGKLLRLVPCIRSPADAGQDKLVQVSGEMQQKIADTVICLVPPPPDIVV